MSDEERNSVLTPIRDDDDWAFLELQAEETALSVPQVVAMLIRKARKAYERPQLNEPAPTTTHDAVCPHHGPYVEICEACHREAVATVEAKRQREYAALEERDNAVVSERDREERAFLDAQIKREAEEQRQREIAERRGRLQAELAALDVGELAAEILQPGAYERIDRGLAQLEANVKEQAGLPEFDESLLRQPEPDPIRAAIIPSSAAPGSLTGPVGVRRDLKGGDIMGDPRMNVIRRNFKHLGAG